MASIFGPEDKVFDLITDRLTKEIDALFELSATIPSKWWRLNPKYVETRLRAKAFMDARKIVYAIRNEWYDAKLARKEADERLQAVVQEAAKEAVWQAVDSTVRNAVSDELRRSPIFRAKEPEPDKSDQGA